MKDEVDPMKVIQEALSKRSTICVYPPIIVSQAMFNYIMRHISTMRSIIKKAYPEMDRARLTEVECKLADAIFHEKHNPDCQAMISGICRCA